MNEVCGDNRFEIIAKAKEAILESTNIETSPDEMAVLDNILFRCWQMGWLDKYGNQPSVDGDLISRQSALAEFRDGRDVYDIMESIEQLPSAPDSRQRGEWVWDEDAMDWGIGAWVCNKCGCRPNTLWSTKRDSIPLAYAGSRFCGYCGAYMGGQNDD